MDDQSFVEEAASYGHKSDFVQALKVAFMYISFIVHDLIVSLFSARPLIVF